MQSEELVQSGQDATAVPAPNVEPAKTKSSNIKKKSKGAVPYKGGVSIKPLYREMVVDAIVTQKGRLGSSLSAIKNHLSSKYKIDVDQKAAAKKLKAQQKSGSGKVGSKAPKKIAKKAGNVKAPAKKASAAKKSATKKASLAKKPAAKKSAAKKPAPKKMGAKPKSAVKGKSAK